jgi:hypothetical protein
LATAATAATARREVNTVTNEPRTTIDDLTTEGHELSDEELRLALGQGGIKVICGYIVTNDPVYQECREDPLWDFIPMGL